MKGKTNNKALEYVKRYNEKVANMYGQKGVADARKTLKKLVRLHNRYLEMWQVPPEKLHRDSSRQENYHTQARAEKAWKRTYARILNGRNWVQTADVITRLQGRCPRLAYHCRPACLIPRQARFFGDLMAAMADDRILATSGQVFFFRYNEDLSWEKFGSRSYSRIEDRRIELVGLEGIVKTYPLDKGQRAESLLDYLIVGRAARRKAAKAAKAAAKKAELVEYLAKPVKVFKLVAEINNNCFSIFNARPYNPGEVVEDTVDTAISEFCSGGGTFVYLSAAEAERAVWPPSAKLGHAPKKIITGIAWGERRSNGNKYAFEFFKAD